MNDKIVIANCPAASRWRGAGLRFVDKNSAFVNLNFYTNREENESYG